jgi:hypothetical protein
LDGSPSEIVPPEKTQVGTEVIPLKIFPGRRPLAFLLVPAAKLLQRLPVIALRVNRRPAVGREVLKKDGAFSWPGMAVEVANARLT